ncbi:MAG: cyclic nucleotide-binding domain-containing protein [Pirellula sp.]|nr:cyclic nucleotide-binding domain-containing protein [Pirellula sp.]
MSASITAIERPVRWDHPFDREMLSKDVAHLLSYPPFSKLDPKLFSASGSLEMILQHDARIVRYEPGDVIVREGDYGNSAFIVLRGNVRAFLVSLWQRQSATQAGPAHGIFSKLLASFKRKANEPMDDKLVQASNPTNEQRKNRGRNSQSSHVTAPAPSIETVDGRSRIFLQDLQAILHDFQSEPLEPGQIFGEMAAITRTPHRFSVVADSPCIVVEIRWQGLRLLRKDPQFRAYIDDRYRQSGLEMHLRETKIFRFLDDDTIQKVVKATKLDSYGELEWFADYKSLKGVDSNQRIQAEPLIASEGTPANDLFLIRAGFARLSFEHGNGHQTTAYLGSGQMFGLDELADSFRQPTVRALPYQQSLRALGFVDLLRIPRQIVLETLLPKVRKSELPPTILNPRYDLGGSVVPDFERNDRRSTLETPLVEFLVDQRLINGRRTMLIDLDRCTGCDECVKACASTHQGTPRFIRSGPQYGSLMFTHACMHCTDPVCMIGCPTGAIHRNPDSGVIDINPNTCIGCKTCSESCPYENIVMQQLKDDRGNAVIDASSKLPILQASKCDLCQSLPTGPACQNACPHAALFRLDTSSTQPLQEWLERKVA